MIWLLVPAAAQPTAAAPLSTGPHQEPRPTCFPIGAALMDEVMFGQVSGRVFLEEASSCPSGGAPTVAPPAVPAEIVGDRNRIQHILDGVAAALPEAPRYGIEFRAGYWYVAPAAGPHLADAVVSVDAAMFRTIVEAEFAIFAQVARQLFVAPRPHPFDGRPNGVSVVDEPLIEALSALWAPLDPRPTSHLFGIHPDAAPNGMRSAEHLAVPKQLDPPGDLPVNRGPNGPPPGMGPGTSMPYGGTSNERPPGAPVAPPRPAR